MRKKPIRKVPKSESSFLYDPSNSTARWSENARSRAGTPFEGGPTCTGPGEFRQTVTLRGFSSGSNRVVHLQACHFRSINDAPLEELSWTTSPPHCASQRLSVSVLKSALQKNVRRGRAGPAVRAAVALSRRTSFSELVRRILVVCVEDAHVCLFHTPALTWLTAAVSRGYEPSLGDVIVALNAVAVACLVTVKDAEAIDGAKGAAPRSSENCPDSWYKNGDADLVTLVRCLQMRACYGGMKGDIAMLRRCAQVWFRRFAEAPAEWRSCLLKSRSAAEAAVPGSLVLSALSRSSTLKKGDIPATAIDFHCSSVCDELARFTVARGEAFPAFQRFGTDCVDGIERLMWTFSSSTTGKATSWCDGVAEDARSPESDVKATCLDELLWVEHLQPLARQFARGILFKAGL